MTAEFDPTAFENFDASSIVFKEEGDDTQDGDEGEGSASQQQVASDGVPIKQATVFVIDCSALPQRQLPQKLFETQKIIKKEEEEDGTDPGVVLANQELLREASAWQEAFSSIATFMRSRIVANKFDKIGVVLYGVSKSETENDGDDNNGSGENDQDAGFPGIVTLLDLDFLTAKGIKVIENHQKENYRSFSRHFPAPQDSSGNSIEPRFSELFWYLNKLFSRKSNLRQYQNKVFLLTANDNPCPSRADKAAAIQRIRDLEDGIAKLECLGLEISGVPSFDVSKFYEEFYGDDVDFTGYGRTTLEKLAGNLRKKVYAQRALCQLPFQILDDFKIGMNLYSSVLPQARPPPYTLNATDNRPVKIQTQMICESTGEILVEEQIRKFLPHGGEQIFIDKEEKQKLNHFLNGEGAAHLRLLGFKPLDRLKRHHTIKHPSFLYPNDTKPPNGVGGSTEVVSALIYNMVEKGLFAVCRYVRVRNSPPRLVALLPQREELDEDDGEQVTPPGFHLIPLPYADDLRHLDLTESQPIEENATKKAARVRMATQLLKKLRLHVPEGSQFDCHDVPNPAIQQHYIGLEALALGQKEPECVVDVMDVGVADSERAKQMAGEWLGKLIAEHGALQGKASASSGGARKPTTKASPAEIPELAEKGTLSSLLVADLKAFCSEKGLPVSGKKADLVDRIEKYLKKKSAKGGKSQEASSSSRTKRKTEDDEEEEEKKPPRKRRAH